MHNIGIIGTSLLENELRVPIYPNAIRSLPISVRSHLIFEKGYGRRFGVSDAQIAKSTGHSLIERQELLRTSQTVIVTKPVTEDLAMMGIGSTACGWMHDVEQEDMAQVAIDRQMTLVCWEHMYWWDGVERTHVFERNNEMAGYCGVQHALELMGQDGAFGPQKSAAVIGYGSVSRGALAALNGHGFRDITVYTRRPVDHISHRMLGIQYRRLLRNKAGSYDIQDESGCLIPFSAVLSKRDVIVNGTLQNPRHPDLFLSLDDIDRFHRPCLIVDVSCSKSMGFSFASPTSFEAPFMEFGNITYYAVDHTPSLLWDAASYEISQALVSFLPDLIAKNENQTIAQAKDIREGEILNPAIIDFQHRESSYPYIVQRISDQRDTSTNPDINRKGSLPRPH